MPGGHSKHSYGNKGGSSNGGNGGGGRGSNNRQRRRAHLTREEREQRLRLSYLNVRLNALQYWPDGYPPTSAYQRRMRMRQNDADQEQRFPLDLMNVTLNETVAASHQSSSASLLRASQVSPTVQQEPQEERNAAEEDKEDEIVLVDDDDQVDFNSGENNRRSEDNGNNNDSDDDVIILEPASPSLPPSPNVSEDYTISADDEDRDREQGQREQMFRNINDSQSVNQDQMDYVPHTPPGTPPPPNQASGQSVPLISPYFSFFPDPSMYPGPMVHSYYCSYCAAIAASCAIKHQGGVPLGFGTVAPDNSNAKSASTKTTKATVTAISASAAFSLPQNPMTFNYGAANESSMTLHYQNCETPVDGENNGVRSETIQDSLEKLKAKLAPPPPPLLSPILDRNVSKKDNCNGKGVQLQLSPYITAKDAKKRAEAIGTDAAQEEINKFAALIFVGMSIWDRDFRNNREQATGSGINFASAVPPPPPASAATNKKKVSKKSGKSKRGSGENTRGEHQGMNHVEVFESMRNPSEHNQYDNRQGPHPIYRPQIISYAPHSSATRNGDFYPGRRGRGRGRGLSENGNEEENQKQNSSQKKRK